ncbi:hypothetical protein [Acidithiobacillus thiooxidans]|jgi:hypothetical protein|uniref:Uncharacterized protein n=1 Tax=Acidithiobacillus thiooxidans ATCC 19377 TaxID=637390 RepID=A0A543Q286_ACITH|nr:hypothetical protein [Acidithiobacillus thiooxidans]MBU2836257.1 hypothetical protein [Acidithiobacillus thiooxidans]MDX5935421.1 hypothetical protein [Acidithiobacillus thiooxidans]QFX96218.1 hypothetical protein GCD22_01953 [Acidithiobacillus thiooxidans ATCC 19377]TQN50443.1 hypothetical protein DLNHIDIE_00296 [Acidithiobacillus thiooxidans ATCC 19377]
MYSTEKDHEVVIVMEGGLIHEVMMNEAAKARVRITIVDMDTEGTTLDVHTDLSGNEITIEQYGEKNSSGPCEYMDHILSLVKE